MSNKSVTLYFETEELATKYFIKFRGAKGVRLIKIGAVEDLQKENKLLRDCVEFYSIEACNEDWCERYLPEYDRGLIDYLSGKKAKECLEKLDGKNE